MDIRIANKYRLGRKIGGGSFGDIYVGKLQSSWNFLSVHGTREISLQGKEGALPLVQLSINFKLVFWKKWNFQNNISQSWLTTAQVVVHLSMDRFYLMEHMDRNNLPTHARAVQPASQLFPILLFFLHFKLFAFSKLTYIS